MADPKIKYDIEAIVSGSADVLALANNIEKLSSGFDGEIKEKALSTAASLRELSRQDALLQAFGELRNSLIDTSFKLSAAKQSIKDLDGVMSLAGKTTREQEGAMQKLKDTAKQLENEFGTQSVAVEKYTKELAIAGIKANDFVNAQVRVKNSLSNIKAEAATMASVLSGVGDGAVKSGQKLQEAFGVLGVKSAETLKAEIASVRGAMETISNASAKTGASLSGAFNAGNQKIKDLERDLRSLNGTLTLSDRAATLFSQSVRHVALGNVVADGVGYLAGKVKQLASAFVETIVHTEQFRKGMTAVYKDTALAEKQFDFLKKTANSAGVSINAIQADFLRFSAAFKNANIPLAQTNELFSTLVHVGSTLGLSNEQVAGTLNALGQMASKGVVSMEELRQQLGDRLPGAMSIAAKGMGVTEGQLIKMVSAGELAYRDFVVPFTNGLRGVQVEAEGVVPTFSRLKNALTEFAQGLGDAGALSLLTGGIKALGAVAGAVIVPLAALAEGLFFAGKSVVAFYGYVRGDKDAFKFLAEEAEKTTARLGKLNDAFLGIASGSKTASDKTQEAAKAAESAAPSYFTLAAAYNKVKENMLVQIELATKEVDSQKAKNAAAIATAKLLGDEAGLRSAVSKAAESESTAIETLASLKNQEVGQLKAELLAKEELLSKNGEIGDDRKKELTDLENLIQKKQVDADKTLAQAAAAKAHAKEVGEVVQAAKAQVAAAETLSITRKTEAQANLSALNTQKELASQAYELAKLNGDERAMREAKIAQVKIEIELTKAKANVMKVEAEGTIVVAQAKLAELKASGQLTPFKEAEISASIKLAEAKIKEAKAIGGSTQLLEKQIELLQNDTTQMEGFGNASHKAAGGQDKFASSTDKATAALERQNAAQERVISAQEKSNELVERADALERKRLSIDKDGFSTDKDGKRIEQSIQTERGVYEQAKSAGLSDQQALAISNEFFHNGRPSGFGGAQTERGETWASVLQKAIDKKVLENARNKTNDNGQTSNNNITNTPAPDTKTTSAAGGRVVNINIGGNRFPVRTDAQGAQNLVTALQIGARNAGM